jgi:hypothetical protein
MDEPISFNKEVVKKQLEDRIKSYQEVINHYENRKIKKAIELLEECGYTVIKNDQTHPN